MREAPATLPTATAAADAVGRLASQLPDVAASPQEGAVVYGAVSWWLDRAERSTLAGDPPGTVRPDPLRTGRATGSYERIRAEVDLGGHLRERYVESLEDSQPVAGDLRAAVEALAPSTEQRLAALHGEQESEERLYRPPGADEVLSRDVHRDHPGRRLLSWNVERYRGEPPYRPIAWPGHGLDFPALEVRSAHRAFAVLDAVDALAERIDDGDDLHPPDAATVREAHSAAIDAVSGLAGSGSPLERWVAWELASGFEEPDGRLDATDAGHRDAVRAYGEYVWIQTVVDRVPAVTDEVGAALES